METLALFYLVTVSALSSFTVWALAFVTGYCSLRFRRGALWIAAGTVMAVVTLTFQNGLSLGHGTDVIVAQLLFAFFWALIFVLLVLAIRAAWHNFIKLDFANGPNAPNQ